GVTGPDGELEGDIHPQDHAELEQPQAKPITSSPHPSTTSVRRAAAEKPGAEGCPQGAPGVPSGRGALLRQEAMASQEDSGVSPGQESPGKVLGKGGSQPEPLGTGESWGMKKVPPRSWSTEVAPAVVGKAGRAVGRQAEVCPWEAQADPSIKMEICPWEESGDKHRELEKPPGKGSSERDPQHLLGTEKPATKPPEMLKVAPEKAESEEGRRNEVCPWESGEGGRSRAEICPWDAEGAQPEQERQEGERRHLSKSIRPTSLGLLRGRESRRNLQRGSPQPGQGEEQPSTGLPALPKTSAKQGGAIENRKINICPWEVEGEPPARAEICPWEEPPAPPGQERPSQDTRGTTRRETKPGAGGLD
ncbi:GP179 protein, partial [Brachypteracias leptosomus]|nr:GP179 protein [Brachypteracias leptosomus]